MKKCLFFLLIIFVPFFTFAYEIGDVDGDYIVGSTDYILIKKHIMKSQILNDNWIKRADLNNDGFITSMDYIIIRKIIMGIEIITPIPTPTSTATPTPTPEPKYEIKTFNQQNDAMMEYLKNPSANNTVRKVYNEYKCSSNKCDIPREYHTSLTGSINVYSYNLNTKEKTFIVEVNANDVNYYLIPNSTYYLESFDDHNNVEVVTITGNLRMINLTGVVNARDLGGWQADGGIVKYGKLFRSGNTNIVSSLNVFNHLGISEVVDLRANHEINHSSAVESIRKSFPINYYTIVKSVRNTIDYIMKSVVNNKNILFNCNLGQDRTGTIAYILEGLLGVSLTDRETDFEITYFHSARRLRNDSLFQSLVKSINRYGKTTYDQECFINWFLSESTNKENDLELINTFRKTMINGNPHEYKLVNGKLALS